MKYRTTTRQAGFTLVEIAIVLVIIGLLLGGVLKGQEIIENARIKSIVNEMKGVQAAYNGYIDRYHALPGDETAAVMTARGWPGAAGPAASDGALAMPLANTFDNGGEQTGFWRALRGSGLITGNPNAPATAAGLPVNGANGLLGVASGPAFGMPGPLVCASGLTPKLAAGVDSLIDGPAAANNTGTLRGISNAAAPRIPTGPGAPAVAAYLETAAVLWTVCMSLV